MPHFNSMDWSVFDPAAGRVTDVFFWSLLQTAGVWWSEVLLPSE
jgi:hypothetical protein